MPIVTPTEDSQALILLCSYLALPRGEPDESKPLTAAEWTELAKRVAASEWQRPGALFGKTAAEMWDALEIDQALADRVVRLLDRAGPLAIELERLQARGIRALTRADALYPPRLKRRLGGQAPPVLFYAGPLALLSSDGIAVLGSRDVAADGERFADALGRRAAQAGLTVYSGGARGVDQVAMAAALSEGGTAVGVVAESLARALRGPDARRHVLDECLALVTPFHPEAGFSVANAMARNRLVYCLADFAVVVASSAEKGGTRAGALENLRADWVPLFVRTGPAAPRGNQDLIDGGGVPLAEDALPSGADLRAWLQEQARRAKAPTAIQHAMPL